MAKKVVCNFDCLNCEFEDCINDEPVYDFEIKFDATSIPKNRTKKQERDLAYRKKKFERLKQQGICVQCYVNPVADGKVLCEQCAAKMKAHRKQNKAQGLCECGKPLVEGRKRCEACLARAKNDSKKKRDYRRANGLCTNCGKPTAGKTYCEECLEKRRIRDEKYKNKRLKGVD